MTDVPDSPNDHHRAYLTPEEDDEVRRLNFLAMHGELSPRSQERLLALRARDRRAEVRPPREFGPTLDLDAVYRGDGDAETSR